MRRAFSLRTLGRSLFALMAGAMLVACGEVEVDLNGEGARRAGALPPGAGFASDDGEATIEIAKAGSTATAPKAGTKVEKTRGRGRRSSGKRGGGSTSYEVAEVADGGTISGMIKLTSKPELWQVAINKDQEACGHDSHTTERCVFDPETLGLANCLVTLEIAKGKDWPEGMKSKQRTGDIDQKACKYIPHVLVVRTKTQVRVSNSDDAEHNIHGYYKSTATNQFNFFTSAGAKLIAAAEAYLKKPGKYLVKCDIHPWMNAYVHAVTTPYFAVTGTDGKFELTGVPAGTYKLKVWHEGMKESPVVADTKITGYEYSPDIEIEREVTVAAGGTVSETFEIEAP